ESGEGIPRAPGYGLVKVSRRRAPYKDKTGRF
ncbi:hypothetical protein A2U01_0088025, partial [Trifolium medium]|nr:hypothetical protein [Trifolium medium]